MATDKKIIEQDKHKKTLPKKRFAISLAHIIDTSLIENKFDNGSERFSSSSSPWDKGFL